MKKIIPILIFLLFSSAIIAQNVAVTDDDSHIADPSAMLDVYSTDKGLLIPRLTSGQRTGIANPVQGLMVFDTDQNAFYFYDGGQWIGLSNMGDIWSKNANNVFTTDAVNKVGVGTSAPIGKLEVKADLGIGIDDPIFEVLNSDGDTIFAVYSNGVRVNVPNDPALKATGSKGGFAVGGFSPAKSEVQEYLRVTPDSVRVYIDDEYTDAKATGSKGGFAVGGFSPAKGSITSNYLFVQDDSTRVFVSDSTSGFGVENIEGGTKQRIMRLTTENYFIGHESGVVNDGGYYNSFLGYHAGAANITGDENVFVGYKTGMSNTSGSDNVFIGSNTGSSNQTSSNNVFIGRKVAPLFTSGSTNVIIGTEACEESTSGTSNVYIGYRSARYAGGGNSVAIGYYSGIYNTGTDNIFLGMNTGFHNTGGILNTFLGAYAGFENQTGDKKVAVGSKALQNDISNSFGQENVAVGSSALFTSTTGTYNTSVGYKSGYYNSTGSQNTFLGYYAGYNTLNSGNVCIGYRAGYYETAGDRLYIHNNDNDEEGAMIYGEFDNQYLRLNAHTHISNPVNSVAQNGLIIDCDGEDTDIPLRIRTNSTPSAITDADTKFIIEGGGNVGIGNANPTYKLDLATNYVGAAAKFFNDGGSYSRHGIYIQAGSDDASGDIWFIRLFDGNGTVVGSIKSTNGTVSIDNSSDRRLKKDIHDTKIKGLDIVNNLRVVDFKYKNTPNAEHTGFIAQEVLDLYPYMVSKDPETGYYSIADTKLIPVLHKAIQEQQKQIQQLEDKVEKINQLEKENNELKAEIEKIHNILNCSAKK